MLNLNPNAASVNKSTANQPQASKPARAPQAAQAASGYTTPVGLDGQVAAKLKDLAQNLGVQLGEGFKDAASQTGGLQSTLLGVDARFGGSGRPGSVLDQAKSAGGNHDKNPLSQANQIKGNFSGGGRGHRSDGISDFFSFFGGAAGATAVGAGETGGIGVATIVGAGTAAEVAVATGGVAAAGGARATSRARRSTPGSSGSMTATPSATPSTT